MSKTESKKGIITYIEKRYSGMLIRLNSKIWVFINNTLSESANIFISYGNTVLVTGVSQYNGRRNILYAQSIKQVQIFDIKKVAKKIKVDEKSKIVNPIFLAYLYYFKKSLYEKFIQWPISRQSFYAANPYRLYLNNHIDYHTAKALSDTTAIIGKEQAIPSMIKYLLSEAQYTKQNYTVDSLLTTINSKYPDITISDITSAFKTAGVTMQGDKVVLNKFFYLREKVLKIISNNVLAPDEKFVEIQKEAPELSDYLKYKYFCITGSGGSGKSTLISKLKNISYVTIAATTGKAAEKLGVKTIHNLLGYSCWGFSVSKISSKVLIVDESSMLDWETLYAIIKASHCVIFVGDLKQLPPVKGDSVFQEITKILPVFNLSTQWRQTNHSVVSINKLNYTGVLNFYKRYMPSIQIITPLVIGPFGTDAINNYIHESLHGTKNIIPNTPVIINQNIYSDKDIIVSNGTTGIIIKNIDNNHCLFRSKKGDFVVPLKCISLAYALTVHKCQGSEWDYVLFLVPPLVKKELITNELKEVALTRARLKTWIANVSK